MNIRTQIPCSFFKNSLFSGNSPGPAAKASEPRSVWEAVQPMRELWLQNALQMQPDENRPVLSQVYDSSRSRGGGADMDEGGSAAHIR
jgi:hypothetical protein